MRVRILGQYVPVSLAVLAIIEALVCFFALYAAVCIRFQVGLSRLPTLIEEFGPLWPRGVAFSLTVVTCLLAFGLYNSRQRTQLSGTLARLLLALLVVCGFFLCLSQPAPVPRCGGACGHPCRVRGGHLAAGVRTRGE